MFAVLAAVLLTISITFVISSGIIPRPLEACAPVLLTIGAVALTLRGHSRAHTFPKWDWGRAVFFFLCAVQVVAEVAGGVGIMKESAWGGIFSLIADIASLVVTFFVTFYEFTQYTL